MPESKKTIIILPGWGGTKETWQPFIERAKEHYNVECINLPCFGDEPCPEKVWGIEEYSHFVESKVKACLTTRQVKSQKLFC